MEPDELIPTARRIAENLTLVHIGGVNAMANPAVMSVVEDDNLGEDSDLLYGVLRMFSCALANLAEAYATEISADGSNTSVIYDRAAQSIRAAFDDIIGTTRERTDTD